MQIYIEVFLIGIFGGIHCIGMCGGFVAMYSMRKPGSSMLQCQIFYNAGRITTYSLLGGLLGGAGSFALYAVRYRGIPAAALFLAGSVMILMGLNLFGILGKQGFFEQTEITKLPVFRRLFRRILASEHAWSIYLFGLLLGFLPCGLLYPVLMTAATSGSFLSGSLTTAAFGLGTVPALMFLGLMVSRISTFLKLAMFRLAALLIILLGIRTILRGLSFSGLIAPGRFW